MTLFNNKTFEDFWNLYDKKVGKVNTLKEWKKLKDIEIERVFEHLPFYIKTREKQFRKDPERYLKHKIFMDEYEEELKKIDAVKLHQEIKKEEKNEPKWNPAADKDWQQALKKLSNKWSMK